MGKPEFLFDSQEFSPKFLIPPAVATSVVWALTRFCNPDVVLQHLHGQIRSLFEQMLNNGNEKIEALKIIEGMPDGFETDLAQRLQGLAGTRRFQKAGKPHRVIYETLWQLAESYKNRTTEL